MEIQTKFNLGQQVWWIESHRECTYQPCPFCGGSKTVKVNGINGDLKTTTCPECRGTGNDPTKKPKASTVWAIGGYGRVGSIRAERSSKQHLLLNPGPDETRYMLSTSSCNLYPEELLFTSSADAKKECDRRNIDESNKKKNG